MSPPKHVMICSVAIKRTEIRLFVVLFSLLPLTAFAQRQDAVMTKIDSLENRIRILEQTAKTSASELDGKFANKAGELENKLESTRLAFQEDFFWAKAFAIVGIGGVLGIVAMFISLMRRAPAIAEAKVKEKFDELLQTKKEQLIALIREQDDERRLKAQKRLLVLHAPGADRDFLTRFFAEMDFKQIGYAAIDDYIPSPEHDLVFFHNDNGDLDKARVVEIANRTPSHVVCFYFGPGRVDTTGNLDRRFAFANARTQLYGNLMNALRHQKLLL